MDSPNLTNEHRWGTSQYLYLGATMAVSVAHGRDGGASSMHIHARKSNCFFVVTGCIELWFQHRPTVRIRAGESFAVRSGEPHRMVFFDDTKLLEIYAADPGQTIDLGDIQRWDLGWVPGEKELVPSGAGATDSAGNPLNPPVATPKCYPCA